MATTLLRMIKYGFQTFLRNRSVSFAAVLVMVWALLVFEGLILLSAVTREAVASVRDKIDISVYFKTNAPEDDILNLERAVEALPEVKQVEYVSRERALELFRTQHADDPNSVVIQALEELQDNPLQASLNIKAHNPDDFDTIARYLGDSSFQPIIDTVTYNQIRLAIDRLTRITKVVEGFALALTLFLALTAALVTFNTISLAIYSNREEIAIMRLVGASNLFINGPYVVVGILYGAIAALVSVFAILPFLGTLSGYLEIIIPEFSLRSYVYGNLIAFAGYELLLGVALGAISSAIAIRRYLKV